MKYFYTLQKDGGRCNFEEPQPTSHVEALTRLHKIVNSRGVKAFSLIVEPDPTPLENLLDFVKMYDGGFRADPVFLAKCRAQLEELMK